MAVSAEPAKQHAEPALAAIDLDQEDWYVAVGDTAGGGETRVLRDASQLVACVGTAAVVATEECKDELTRAAPRIQARFVPRLVSVARAFREEIGGVPCLVFWMGRKQAACGLVEGEKVVAENTDTQLTLPGIFQHFAATNPGLQAWMSYRDEQQRTAAFENFVSNLKHGKTLPVGSGRWMPTPARIPVALVKDGFGRLRDSVDPTKQAAKLVVSGWASAAHWDLAVKLGREFEDLSLIARPNGSGFYESVAGLIDYGWENPAPGQKRPAAPWTFAKSRPEPDKVATVAVTAPPVEVKETPPPIIRERKETAEEPPVTVSAAPPVAVHVPPPPPPPPTDLKPEANGLQSQRVVRLAKAAAALVETLGARGAAHRQSLKPYLTLAQQSDRLSEIMERGDSDAQRKELNSFRGAVSGLEKRFKATDFFGLLDAFRSDEPGAVEILDQAGIEPIDLLIGSEILPSAELEVLGRTGTGRRRKVSAIHHRGYKIDGKVVRPPRVDVVLYDVKRPRKWMHVGLVAGALAALLVVAYVLKPRPFKHVATVAVGEPVLSVWSVPGTDRLVAQSANGQPCSLRIWQAPQWNNPVVLPASCGPTAVSADGTLAAWSSADGRLPTITGTNNVPLRTMGPQQYQHDGAITALAFTPDGQFLYSVATDGFVRQWKVQGDYVKDLADQDRKPLQSLLVAGNLVAAGEATTPGARIKVWLPGHNLPFMLAGDADTPDGSQPGPPMAAVTAMAYDAAAGLFFAGTADGEVLTWQLKDYAEGKHLPPGERERPAQEKVQTTAIAPGARLFVSYADSVFSWRYTSTEMTRDPPFSFGNAISGTAAFSDGQDAFLAVGGGGDDHSIAIWRIAQ